MGRRLLISYTALKNPLQTKPNSNLTPENCSPGPCTNLNGYTIWVSNIHLDKDIVHLTVKFKNSSTSTHASPEDLVVIDAERRQSSPATDVPGCKSFARHEFSKGETYGPIDLCFRVTDTTPPFILHWSPDLGAFCCQHDLTIWPT